MCERTECGQREQWEVSITQQDKDTEIVYSSVYTYSESQENFEIHHDDQDQHQQASYHEAGIESITITNQQPSYHNHKYYQLSSVSSIGSFDH